MFNSLKNKIRNIIKIYFTDRKHDKWITLINKYYKSSMQDPENLEIYLHKLLNGGVLDKQAVTAVKENKNYENIYDIINADTENIINSNKYSHKIKNIILECLKEVRKYKSILIHRKY